MLQVATLPTGKWKENCYVVYDKNRVAAVIDPGEDAEIILEFLHKQTLKVAAVLNTHAHYDHVGAVSSIKKTFAARFYLHRGDFKLLSQANFYRLIFEGERTVEVPEVDGDLAEKQALCFGEIDVRVLLTPGHTAGSVSFLIDDKIFTGDTIIGRKPGRTDLPGGNKTELESSVQRLLELPPQTLLYPGHGKPVTIEEIQRSMAQREHAQ